MADALIPSGTKGRSLLRTSSLKASAFFPGSVVWCSSRLLLSQLGHRLCLQQQFISKAYRRCACILHSYEGSHYSTGRCISVSLWASNLHCYTLDHKQWCVTPVVPQRMQAHAKAMCRLD